nr:unnamed protein product [Callosobruchus analis]
MKGSQVFKGISKTIQNELLEVRPSPPQILTTKQREWILCTKIEVNFFLCPPSFKAHEPPQENKTGKDTG